MTITAPTQLSSLLKPQMVISGLPLNAASLSLSVRPVGNPNGAWTPLGSPRKMEANGTPVDGTFVADYNGDNQLLTDLEDLKKADESNFKRRASTQTTLVNYLATKSIRIETDPDDNKRT